MCQNNSYLLIAGDLVPTKKNENFFSQGNIDAFFDNDFKGLWTKASYRIFNLETPLSEHSKYLDKAGVLLGAKTATFNGIEKLLPDLVCLANNHILDLEKKGALDTIELLEKSQINYIGIGKNINEMKDHQLYTYNDKRICIYNCCEHEFTYATTDKFGTNPFNPLTSLFRIQALKNECDYLIVIYHGGKELYQYCTPKLQEICHSISNAGADLIVCQHSHCIGCYEKFKNSTIVYGQGNFIFDVDEDGLWNELTKEGLFIKLNLNDFSIEFVEYYKDNGILKLRDFSINNGFYTRSLQIKDNEFVKERYINEIEHTSFHYFRQILSTKYLGFIDKKFLGAYFMKKRYKKLRLLLINYLDCEVHYENILTYLKEIKELNKS